MHTLKLTLLLAAATGSALAADEAAPALPVSVSSAYYGNLPWDQLRQAVSNPNQATRSRGKPPRWRSPRPMPSRPGRATRAICLMTTSGLQVFNDARATVKLGELQVLDPDVKLRRRRGDDIRRKDSHFGTT